jgi:excisionase family DNA binding protein
MVHQRENPKPIVIDVGEKTAVQAPKPPAPRMADATAAILAQLLDRMAPPQLTSAVTNEAPLRWITLDEAEQYLGLPATVLRDLIEDGILPAIDVGIRAGGRWRVKRADLDAIEGEKIPQAQHA